MTQATQTEPKLVLEAEKHIGTETHRLRLYKLPECSDRWFDGVPRRFELVYTWMDAATGGVKGQEVQGATWNDYRQAQKKGLFGHYSLF